MTVKIEHIALWVDDIETVRRFYMDYFGAESSAKYVNPAKGYASYFISFGEGCRIELMNKPGIAENRGDRGALKGLAHLSLSAGGRERVDGLTERLRGNGYVIAGEPRVTGDGYYESVVLDPEGNYVEITE